MHSLDCMCFLHFADGRWDCILIVHVDDFLIGWARSFDIGALKKMFKWGRWSELLMGSDGVQERFVGKEITRFPDRFLISQKQSS